MVCRLLSADRIFAVRRPASGLRITNVTVTSARATGIVYPVYAPPLCEHNGLAVTTAAVGRVTRMKR